LISSQPIDFSNWIPIFPLPDAVLLPGAVLPLHVFEQRYRCMTGDALAGPRLVAMALLKPGFEPVYHTHHAEIHRVLCVGRILKEEMLPDGRYNFLLAGVSRVRVLEENCDRPYRRALLQQVFPEPCDPEAEQNYRAQLQQVLAVPHLRRLAEQAHWLDLFKSDDLSFSDLLDVLGGAVLCDTAHRQRFLAEPRVEVRARQLHDALRAVAEKLQTKGCRVGTDRPWPPPCSSN
jgi:Lon protease-like protein